MIGWGMGLVAIILTSYTFFAWIFTNNAEYGKNFNIIQKIIHTYIPHISIIMFLVFIGSLILQLFLKNIAWHYIVGSVAIFTIFWMSIFLYYFTNGF